MASFAGKAGRSLALFVRVVGFGAVLQQKLGKIAAVGRCGREDRSKSARLRCVGIGSMVKQKSDRFCIAPEGEGSMQRLVGLHVL